MATAKKVTCRGLPYRPGSAKSCQLPKIEGKAFSSGLTPDTQCFAELLKDPQNPSRFRRWVGGGFDYVIREEQQFGGSDAREQFRLRQLGGELLRRERQMALGELPAKGR